MINKNSRIRWSQYYNNTKTCQPSQSLQFAISILKQSPNPHDLYAVDIGCGGGRDMRLLLEADFRVTGVDSNDGAHQELIRTLSGFDASLWEFRHEKMEAFVFPRCNLINASNSLYFCSREAFLSTWQSMCTSLKEGGLLVLDVLGDRDDWVNERGYGGFSREELFNFLTGFDVLLFDERGPKLELCADKTTLKNWHIFSLVAKKIDSLSRNG